ncbi:hypothetical protein C8J56DRAFT_827123, partial [Mycena floridula]
MDAGHHAINSSPRIYSRYKPYPRPYPDLERRPPMSHPAFDSSQISQQNVSIRHQEDPRTNDPYQHYWCRPPGDQSFQEYQRRQSVSDPSSLPVQYTDESSTRVHDRLRRRCFNCRATYTTAWRRSNLNPGKLLCNKCGLFERTHSRPRPEHFPNKREYVAPGLKYPAEATLEA